MNFFSLTESGTQYALAVEIDDLAAEQHNKL